MYRFKFQIPPYYTLLVRSLSVLEVSSAELGREGWGGACSLWAACCLS